MVSLPLRDRVACTPIVDRKATYLKMLDNESWRWSSAARSGRSLSGSWKSGRILDTDAPQGFYPPRRAGVRAAADGRHARRSGVVPPADVATRAGAATRRVRDKHQTVPADLLLWVPSRKPARGQPRSDGVRQRGCRPQRSAPLESRARAVESG